MSDELKPCPLCGSEAILIPADDESPAEVYCSCYCSCGCSIIKSDTAGAIAAWNARAAVTDEQFAMAVHDGRAWQVVRECEWSPEHDGENFVTECGAMFFWEPPAPLHCPHCGGHVKVVAE